MSHFDVDGNEMNINAIHDIQSVNIKQDEDILKNEVANDAFEEDDNIFVNNVIANDVVDSGGDGTNSILNNNLQQVPIVYTTRLDEMDIFDKIEKYTPNEVAVLIQYESKPQYKQILPIKREPCGFHTYSFMKLYSDIERLNQKVQTETKERNDELMSMCKPLKIVLKDIKYDEAKTTDSGSKNFNQTNRKPHSTQSKKKVLVTPKMAEKGVVKSVAKFQKLLSIKVDDSDDSDSLDDMPLTMLKACVNDSTQILPGSTMLAFINKISMKANIYIIDYCKDLRCSYETNSEKLNLIKIINPTNNTLVYDVCCWVKREKQIKLVCQSKLANENAISFMRIPHGCLPAPCTCCCILEPPMPMLSSVTFMKMSKIKSETNSGASKLIRKAYSSREKLQSSKICAVGEPITFLKSAVIMMKYKDIIFSQSIDLGENYEIGIEGDIDNHVKLTVNRSLTEERILHEKHDEENKICRHYFSYLICCWCKREEIIVNLSKVHNLSSRACKYIRNPHLCKSHKCQCCCKRAEIGLPLDDKNIATLPQSTKQSKGIREHKKMNPIAIDKSQATKIKKIYIDKNKHTVKTVAPGKTVDIEKKTKNNQKSVAVMVSHCQPKVVHTISQTVAEPLKESQPYVAKTIEPPTASTELVTSIFDKFRELKLSVNANGKLTANINTPPEKLLPEEIKALAEQLAKASNQMHQLGIGPEEFCRRVNLNSLMNATPSTGIPNIPLPPKLPIIAQSSPLIRQESISPPPLCPIAKKTVQNNIGIIQPPQASKLVKQKSQLFKTNQISKNFPRTTNSSKVANLYSMMSHTGWIRTRCMIAAYNIHFGIEMNEKPEPLLLKNNLTNIDEQQLPKIINVQSLVDTAPNTNIISNGYKKREKQADKSESKGESCKIRVLPPERISAVPISSLPISTQMNMISLANLTTLTKNVVYPVEPIPSHSQEHLFDRNSSLNTIQNVNGVLASSLPNAGNNIVLNSGPPTIHLPDSGKIWAYIDGQLVELKVLPNAASQNNIALHQNYDIPKIGTVNHTPMITVSNGIPMQVSRLCADTVVVEDVKAPTVNVETQESAMNASTVNEEEQEKAMNALLRDMLSKDSPLPNLPQPTRKHRYANALKRTVTPLILEHSKELKIKKRKVLDDPMVSSAASKENLQNAATEDSIQIIDSEEEQESIFGV